MGIASILAPTAILAVFAVLFLAIAQNFANAESLSPPAGESVSGDAGINYAGYYENLQKYYSSGIGGLSSFGELTEEQRQNTDRLLKMPVGKMNPEIWLRATSQISCLSETKQVKDNKISEAQMAEIVKPYGVTYEEYMAFYLQMMTGKLDTGKFENFNVDIFSEKTKQEYETLKKDNCRPPGISNKKQGDFTGSAAPMTDAVWFEITARIRCLDRTLYAFTKYEINNIFTPFGSTLADYKIYSEGMIKKMENFTAKNENQWTKSDRDFALQYKQFNLRLENLKKNKCVLENGQEISEEYSVGTTTLTKWETSKCKLFSCNNCYGVTSSSSFWEKYRCKNLCAGCPVDTPPIKPVTNCSGFCSLSSCPDYAEKVSGTCALEKVCTKCGLWNAFTCCKEKEAVCCQPKPVPACSCSLKTCPKGLVSEGAKGCASGTEKYKCGLFKLFTCKREVSGVCCR